MLFSCKLTSSVLLTTGSQTYRPVRYGHWLGHKESTDQFNTASVIQVHWERDLMFCVINLYPPDGLTGVFRAFCVVPPASCAFLPTGGLSSPTYKIQ